MHENRETSGASRPDGNETGLRRPKAIRRTRTLSRSRTASYYRRTRRGEKGAGQGVHRFIQHSPRHSAGKPSAPGTVPAAKAKRSYYARSLSRAHHVQDTPPGTIGLFFQIVTPLPSSVRGLPSGPFTDIRSVPVEYAKSPDWETSTFSVFQVMANPGVANDSVTYLRTASLPSIGGTPGTSMVVSSDQNGSARFRSYEPAAASRSASVL